MFLAFEFFATILIGRAIGASYARRYEAYKVLEDADRAVRRVQESLAARLEEAEQNPEDPQSQEYMAWYYGPEGPAPISDF